jgi:aspartate-semialdehyde dehydrogenase
MVHVGHIGVDPHDPRAFWFWVVSDTVRIGAALNAVHIAEHLIRKRAFSLHNTTAVAARACPTCRSAY